MDTIKVYLGEDGSATIRCGQCGRKKIIDASKFKGLNKQLTVKCQCGHSFVVSFEARKFYRKDVTLSGEYLLVGGGLQEAGGISVETIRFDGMVLENLCLGGVAFRTNKKHNLKAGEIIQVTFELDDAQKSLISRNVMVKSVDGQLVRAEFCDNKPDKALAFYLMP